jgi:hypothetical protein
MKNFNLFTGIICLILLFPVSDLQAANHALLIGVGDYPHLDKKYGLEGPPNDVAALKSLLKTSLNFSHIITLVDNKASKENILKELNKLETSTRPGDSIFIYFSGHGTSSYDLEKKDWGIDPCTGALLPADFRPDKKISNMMNSLIIGKRDIRPILETLEKERLIFAVFDSCYSGDAVRSFLNRRGKAKYAPLTGIVDLTDSPESPAYGTDTIKEPPYPYQNVIYISAASRIEPARDITKSDIEYGNITTVDGKPHGALTDALLRAFQGAGDSNNDGKITYSEVYHYVREDVSRRFSHTPQMLCAEEKREMLENAIFDKNIPAPVPPSKPDTTDTDKTLRVRPEKLEKSFEQKISEIPGVTMAEKDYDLLVMLNEGVYRLYLPNDVMLISFPQTEPDDVIERIRRQVHIRELTELSFPNQKFNVSVSLIGQKAVLTEGEDIGFVIRSEADSHILIINIDPAGLVNVIYPCYDKELLIIKANQDLSFPELSKVVPPNFGTEYIKVFAFKKQPESLKNFICAEDLLPTDSRFADFMKMIGSVKNDAAQMTLQVKTCAKKDIVRSW